MTLTAAQKANYRPPTQKQLLGAYTVALQRSVKAMNAATKALEIAHKEATNVARLEAALKRAKV